MKDTFHLYTDLAWLWPLWGDASEYAAYGEYAAGQIRRYARHPVRSLLNMGCGGGKNMFNLKQHFDVTGLDVSAAMLEQARNLNPECSFVQADMRTARLGRFYDAVLMDDAIAYMASLTDFAAAIRTAAAHLKPGGVLLATADATAGTLVQNQTTVTRASRENLEVVFVENVYDPDPADEQYETTVIYIIRDCGRLRIETDHWTLGVFPLETWHRVLRDAGFEVHESSYQHEGCAYAAFACVRREGC